MEFWTPPTGSDVFNFRLQNRSGARYASGRLYKRHFSSCSVFRAFLDTSGGGLSIVKQRVRSTFALSKNVFFGRPFLASSSQNRTRQGDLGNPVNDSFGPQTPSRAQKQMLWMVPFWGPCRLRQLSEVPCSATVPFGAHFEVRN